MNKKSLLGLILFACLIISGMFASVVFLTRQNNRDYTDMDRTNTTKENTLQEKKSDTANSSKADSLNTGDSNKDKEDLTNEDTAMVDESYSNIEEAAAGFAADMTTELTEGEPWLSTNPGEFDNAKEADRGSSAAENKPEGVIGYNESSEIKEASTGRKETEKGSIDKEDQISEVKSGNIAIASASTVGPKLIYDCNEVDYMTYIPEMAYDSELKKALKVSNPEIDVDAEAAILFDAKTKKVIYYKNPVVAEFPASTAKLLTSLVALDWCTTDEEVTIGDEITMIASDSTKALIRKGEVLTIRNLLEGMLLPSGNDAAYAVAAYVGRQSLDDAEASKEEAVMEFTRLMNEKAKRLGVKNSCFKTPDGYDAIGQYTTAYDMGLIGMAAADNEVITDISQRSRSSNTFVSGEEVTWNNTNKLVTRYSGQYYSRAIGLKTGTSTMAGRCLIAAAEDEDDKVVCVIMDSTSAGRWEDAIALLKYGLN